MRRAAVSLVIAFSSGFIICNESYSQTVGRPGTLQVIKDMNDVNRIIKREFQVVGFRCRNQRAREKWVQEDISKLAPALAKLTSDKAAAQATLGLAARNLAAAQNALGAATSAIAAIDVQLRDHNLEGAQRIALIVRQIVNAIDEQEIASDLLDNENTQWDRWKDTGTNDDDLDEAANKQFTNIPLNDRDRAVLQKLREHQAAVDLLEIRVSMAENSVAAFRRARQEAENGLQQTVAQLEQQKRQRLEEKKTAQDRIAALSKNRDANQVLVRSLTARIVKLSAIKAPAIDGACNAFPATR